MLERKAPPTFDIAIEMLERQSWAVHESVATTVDHLLRGIQPTLQVRTINEDGEVSIVQERYTPLTLVSNSGGSASKSTPSLVAPPMIGGLRSSGKMMPVPENKPLSEKQFFDQLLEQSFSEFPLNSSEELFSKEKGLNGEDLPLHIYPYGVPRHQIEQVVQTLSLPIVLTKDIDSADVVLALRSHIRNQSKLRHMAKTRQVPIHTLKAGTPPQIVRALRRLLNMEDPSTPDLPDLTLFTHNGSSDELEALEEARLAVEQIVIPKGQPVELLPRSASVRKMQHELVEHYRLKSNSFGEEPNRRLRIYPA